MGVGDLVRLRPEHNDVGWLDVVFIITKEDKQTGMVEISTADWTFPMPKRFLEVAYE
mgnify:FL=1|jgi:hypothetical protein